MSFRKKSTNQYIPEGLCYDLWVKRRYSLKQIARILHEEYSLLNRNGGLVTVPAIERSAWMYALDNLEIAKSDTVSIYKAEGRKFDENEWYQEVETKARRFLSQKSYRKFMAKYPFILHAKQ